jgi:hypothetical protein
MMVVFLISGIIDFGSDPLNISDKRIVLFLFLIVGAHIYL